MKRLLMLCMLSAVVVMTQAHEVVLDVEMEEVMSLSACPCSKSCRCDESCGCRISGCRGCCNQYVDERTKAGGSTCVAAYCDCEESRCGCGCSEPNKSCCS